MQICNAMKFLRIAAVPVISIVIGVSAFVSARAQANPSTTPAAPPVQLQTYTAQDQSASAGVPAGWKVVGAAQTNIVLSGPQGEVIDLGEGIIAHDGPFQMGQTGWFSSSVPRSTEIRLLRLSSFTRRLFNRYRLGSNAACLLSPFPVSPRRVMPWAYSARFPKTPSSFLRTF